MTLATEWKYKELEQLAEKIDYGHTASADFSRNGPKFLRITDIQNGVVDWDSVPSCIATKSEEAKYSLGEGDIVFARTGATTGKSFLIGQVATSSLFASYLIRVRPNKLVNPRFLSYFFNTPNYWAQIKSSSRGAGQPGVNSSSLRKLRVPLPPMEEQKRIADILDKANGIRRKRLEANELTEHFLRSQFVELFGDPHNNPRNWRLAKLEDVSQLQSGVTKGRKLEGKKTVDVPYMRVWNVQDAHIRLGSIKNITVLETDVDKYRLEVGDLLLTEGGDPDQLGRGAIWYAPIPVCIHQNHIFRVRANTELVVPEFLSAMIGSEFCKRYFLKMAKQTTGIASINMRQLKACPVLLPPLKLQEKFSRIEKRFKEAEQTLDARFKEADTLFDSIAQKAFSGKL